MKLVLSLVGFACILFVLFAAYVRLAPSTVVDWHIDPTNANDPKQAGVLTRVRADLTAFDAVARKTSSVSVLAGSVEAGHITYIARTKLMGFPDYITVKQVGDELVILSRLRFGKSDLGVNAGRLKAWISKLPS